MRRLRSPAETAQELMCISKPLLVAGNLGFCFFTWILICGVIYRFVVVLDMSLLNPIFFSSALVCLTSTASFLYMRAGGYLSSASVDNSDFRVINLQNILIKLIFEFLTSNLDFVFQMKLYNLSITTTYLAILRALANTWSVCLPIEEPHFFAASRLVSLFPQAYIGVLLRDAPAEPFGMENVLQVLLLARALFAVDCLYLFFNCFIQPTALKFSAADFQVPVPRPIRFLVDSWVGLMGRVIHLGSLTTSKAPQPDKTGTQLAMIFSYSDIVTAFMSSIVWGVMYNNSLRIPLPIVILFCLGTITAALALVSFAARDSRFFAKQALLEKEEALAVFHRKTTAARVSKIDLIAALGHYLKMTLGYDIQRAFVLLNNSESKRSTSRSDLLDKPPPPPFEVLWITNEVEKAQKAAEGATKLLSSLQPRLFPSRPTSASGDPAAAAAAATAVAAVAAAAQRIRRGAVQHKVQVETLEQLEDALGLRAADGAAASVSGKPYSFEKKQMDLIDSRLVAEGIKSFEDWHRAHMLGTERALMVPIMASDKFFGTLHIHLDMGVSDAIDHSVLLAAADGLAVALRYNANSALSLLLNDMMPEHVSEKMYSRNCSSLERSTGTVWQGSERIPEESIDVDDLQEDVYDEVTVVTCDVQHYTESCATSDALECMRTLHRLFQRMDDACSRLGVSKLDTLGDSFIAVANLFSHDPEHARTAIRLGTELHRAAQGLSLGGAPLRVRVGISTGSLTGCVVGKIRRKYVTFGQPLKEAGRLELMGAPNMIHIARSTLLAAHVRPNAPGVEQRLIRVYKSKSDSSVPREGTGGASRRPYDYVLSYFFAADDATVNCVLHWGNTYEMNHNGLAAAVHTTNPFGSIYGRPVVQKGPSFNYDVDKHEKALSDKVAGASPRGGGAVAAAAKF